MRRVGFSFLVPVFLLTWAVGQDQFPAPIQSCVSNTTTCAFAHNVVTGDVIIVGARSEGSLTAPTDTRSTTWTLMESNTAGGAFAYAWCGTLGSGGAETITLTGSLSFQGSNSVELPASVGCTLDGSAHTNGSYSGTPGTVTMSSITTATNGDFIFSYATGFRSSGYLFAQAPTLNLGVGTANDSDGSGYRISGTNGSYNAVFTNAVNDKGSYVIFALKPASITIATASLPTAFLSNSYAYCLQARGGAGAYTWSVSSGALPSGLSINSGTGCITGTPTGGPTTPTFQVTDGTHTTTSALPLTVNSSAGTVGFVNSAAASSGTISMGTVTAGNLLLVAQSVQNGGGSGSVTWIVPSDNLSTPTIFHFLTFLIVSRDLGFAIFEGVPTVTGTDTITPASVSGQNAEAAQFSNVQAFFDVVGNTSGTNSGSATLTGPALTTLSPSSEVWLAVTGFSGNSTWNAGSGYTIETLASATGSPVNSEHANQSSVSTYTPTIAQTANTDGRWIIQALALRPTTSGVVSLAMRHSSQIF